MGCKGTCYRGKLGGCGVAPASLITPSSSGCGVMEPVAALPPDFTVTRHGGVGNIATTDWRLRQSPQAPLPPLTAAVAADVQAAERAVAEAYRALKYLRRRSRKYDA